MYILFKCTQNVCQDILGHKPNLDKFKRTEITQSVFSDHKIKSDIHNEDIWEIFEELAFNNTLINNPRVKGEITKYIRRQFALNENENPTHQKSGMHRSQRLRDRAKPCVREVEGPQSEPDGATLRERTGRGWGACAHGPGRRCVALVLTLTAPRSQEGCTLCGFAPVLPAGRRESAKWCQPVFLSLS